MDALAIGSRIKDVRERQNLSQEDLANAAGLKNRQAVAAIEKGSRDAKYSELVSIAKVLKLDISSLFPSIQLPFIQTAILWRKEPNQDKKQLEQGFLHNISSYQLLENTLQSKRDFKSNLEIFDIDPDSFDFKDAYHLAEILRTKLNLGNEPSKSLAKTLEDHFGVRIFYADLEDNGSAASYRNGEECAILLNSSEAPWRRNYSLAHELFHLVTWTPKVFSRINTSEEYRLKIEQLAEAFAAGLLMPEEHLRREFEKNVHGNKISHVSLIALARQFDVSISALLYRLAYIRLLPSDTPQRLIHDQTFRNEDKKDMFTRWNAPQEFPDRFIRLAFQAYAQSKISRSKIANMLKLPLIDLPPFFENCGFHLGAENEIEIAFA